MMDQMPLHGQMFIPFYFLVCGQRDQGLDEKLDFWDINCFPIGWAGIKGTGSIWFRTDPSSEEML
jgi:hypothetical protein